MLKVMSLLKRAEGLSHDAYAKWAVEEHVAFARKLPGLRRYTVNIVNGDDGPYDSVHELYFDDEDARAAAFGSEHGRAAAADASAHTSSRVHLLTTEHAQL
ncbi:EthD family reductase [Nonomuraea longispora]|uniref:EthD family reductase n=1 Tax=Nonomuraea longispora TaxID=1848320 RepID=A0A4R4NA61_9ACTN|nr:EthD family reductase [Nonomuraea longispora]TDC05775.1 EthD family reductase [Nonomuraea longispora]